jgi:transcriptional regulator with XRE-family HTH domain
MEGQGPGIERSRLGRQLRQLRTERGLRLEDVAARLGVAPSTLSRIEVGIAPVRASYLAFLLDLYGVSDPSEREQLAGSAREGQRKGWWADHNHLLSLSERQYFSLEITACAACSYAPIVIPDLLQTRDYALAVIKAARPAIRAAPARELAEVLARRQEVQSRGGFTLHVVIDEPVLRWAVGSPHIMARQLRHLAACSGNPAITIQVTPMTTPRQVLCPAFSVLSFPADPQVAFTHGPGGPARMRNSSRAEPPSSTFTRLTRTALPAAESARMIRQLSASTENA